MKRWIHTAEDLTDSTPGFLFNFGNRDIFLRSNKSNLTSKIVRDFINIACDLRNVGDAIREKALYDEATLKDFRSRITKAELEQVSDDWYRISGRNFTFNFPKEDFDRDVIVRDARE